MSKRLSRVLLIDDNPSDNFLHLRVLKRANCAEQVFVFESAQEALNFLKSNEAEARTGPELIVLDINMPGMNGWEFLDAHRGLPETARGGVVIAMVTTTLSPRDARMAARYPEIAAHATKPLTLEWLNALLQRYFP